MTVQEIDQATFDQEWQQWRLARERTWPPRTASWP